MRSPEDDPSDQPIARGMANALAQFVSGFLSTLADLLVARLVEPLAEKLAEAAERRLVEGGERLSLTAGAKRAKVRPATVCRAAKLPPDHPGFLPSRSEGPARGALTGTERRTVLWRDLLRWRDDGGAHAVLLLGDGAATESADAS